MRSVYPYALLSADAYLPEALALSPELNLSGWERAPVNTMNKAQFAKGFYGRAYYNESRNEVVIAFRGTVPTEIQNHLQNSDIVLYKKKGRYHQSAQNFLRTTQQNTPRFLGKNHYRLTLTGHSLGGMMAKLLATEDPSLRAIAFDSPGISAVEEVHKVEEVVVTASKFCSGMPGGNPFNGVFKHPAKVSCAQVVRRYKKVFKQPYENIQTILSKNSMLGNIGEHVGYKSEVTIESLCHNGAFKMIQKVNAIAAIYCIHDLHQIESMAAVLKINTVPVMV